MFKTFKEAQKDDQIKKLIGQKAASLINMLEWGLPVPQGGCVITEAFEQYKSINKLQELLKNLTEKKNLDEQLKNAKVLQESIENGELPSELTKYLKEFLNNNEEKYYAVRSSGLKEDLQGMSFAGQYSSYLNTKGLENIEAAVKKCWASMFNERLIVYCFNNKIEISDLKIAVIIQEMVAAEKSGVVFTVNPLKGFDKEMVIEACFGLGEALVGGEVTPDQYYFDWYNTTETQRVVREKAVLSAKEVDELAQLALQIQIKYGFPVDIEWAKDKEKFYILQSRPITKINYSGIEGEWTTADFKDGGVSSTVCTPFMWSLYDYIWENSLPSYLKKVKLFDKDNNEKLGDMFYGRPYWKFSAVKEGLMRIPGFVERDFDEDLGIEVTYEGKGKTSKLNFKTIVNAVKVITALQKSIKNQLSYCTEFKQQQLRRLEELDTIDHESIARDKFFVFYESFIKNEYYHNESTYFNHIYNNTNYQSLFKDKMKKLKCKPNLVLLMSGLNNISHLQPNFCLWDISRSIREDIKSYEFWKASSVGEITKLLKEQYLEYKLPMVDEFIKSFKHHSTRELDLTIPRYDEDSSFVIESIKSYIDLGEENNPRTINEKQIKAYNEEKQRILKSIIPLNRRYIDKEIEKMRLLLWWREELRDISTKYYYCIRKHTLILADYFINMGLIDKQDDIFFIPIEQIFKVLNGNLKETEVKEIVCKNRRYYDSFRNFQNSNEIGSRYEQNLIFDKKNTKLIKGNPCSNGMITGTAKVIADIFDSDRIQKGDILITKFTDPGWTPKFGLISGIATETGGLLSHAAVISREYGIPCVLAVKDITKIIKDGQKISLNGTTGEIILHD